MPTLAIGYLLIGLGVGAGLTIARLKEVKQHSRLNNIIAISLSVLFWPLALYNNYNLQKD